MWCQQKDTTRRGAAINVLLDRGILAPGQEVVFDPDAVSEEATVEYDPTDAYWRAEVTGETGRSNNVRWLHTGETYSFTGLSKTILADLVGRDRSKALNGYTFWVHPDYDERTLRDLRNNGL